MLKLFVIEAKDIPPGGAPTTVSVSPQMRCQPMILRTGQATAGAFNLISITSGVEPILDWKAGESLLNYTNLGIRPVVMEVFADFAITVVNPTDAPADLKIDVWGLLCDHDPGYSADRYLRILYEAEDSRRQEPTGELDQAIEAHYAAKLDAIYEKLTPVEIDLIESEALRLNDGGLLPWDGPPVVWEGA